ncbi:XapX domain-containing protein [Roseateles sp. BYS78W]|uniref:XapX domain-containing protein n=1 Tax=Pelomonas candidula TaxID=3299025 RepID=A0ABW7HHV9_9BURK
MKLYLLSVAAGLLVGVIYALLHVKSPAPPAVALLGLLGIATGEQLGTMAQRLLNGEHVSVAWFKQTCVPKITGIDIKQPEERQS